MNNWLIDKTKLLHELYLRAARAPKYVRYTDVIADINTLKESIAVNDLGGYPIEALFGIAEFCDTYHVVPTQALAMVENATEIFKIVEDKQRRLMRETVEQLLNMNHTEEHDDDR